MCTKIRCDVFAKSFGELNRANVVDFVFIYPYS